MRADLSSTNLAIEQQVPRRLTHDEARRIAANIAKLSTSIAEDKPRKAKDE